MSGLFVVAGKAGALYFDGVRAFVKDLGKAKAYANAVAAKRAMNKAQATTGRNGLRIVSAEEIARMSTPPKTASKPQSCLTS